MSLISNISKRMSPYLPQKRYLPWIWIRICKKMQIWIRSVHNSWIHADPDPHPWMTPCLYCIVVLMPDLEYITSMLPQTKQFGASRRYGCRLDYTSHLIWQNLFNVWFLKISASESFDLSVLREFWKIQKSVKIIFLSSLPWKT